MDYLIQYSSYPTSIRQELNNNTQHTHMSNYPIEPPAYLNLVPHNEFVFEINGYRRYITYIGKHKPIVGRIPGININYVAWLSAYRNEHFDRARNMYPFPCCVNIMYFDDHGRLIDEDSSTKQIELPDERMLTPNNINDLDLEDLVQEAFFDVYMHEDEAHESEILEEINVAEEAERSCPTWTEENKK